MVIFVKIKKSNVGLIGTNKIISKRKFEIKYKQRQQKVGVSITEQSYFSQVIIQHITEQKSKSVLL